MGLPQLPLSSHAVTPPPEHPVVPGMHTPTQAPDTHAELTHGCMFVQVPVASHVWTALPEQRVAPGTHTPVHEPSTHA